jgi:hypothetical protein
LSRNQNDADGCAILLVALVAFGCLAELLIPAAAVSGVVVGVALYVGAMYRALVGAPELRSHIPAEGGEQPAYVRYFDGPALADLRAVISGTRVSCINFAKRCTDRINRDYFHNRPTTTALVGAVLVLALWTGVAAGAIAAALALTVHAVTVLVLQAVAWAAIGALRVTDTTLLRLRGITITCGTCHHRVPFPVYACPGAGCRLRHGDVRPGRFGALARVCACGARLPTLLVLGSYRMKGFCPYCDRPLADRIGSAREIAVPFLGPTASGKTRLMLTLVTALEELSVGGGGRVVQVSADTVQRLGELRATIARGQSPPPTRTELPRAYSLNATTGRGPEWFVHLFDVAGERLNRRDDADELRYLALARTFVFVVDPLAVAAFWDGLPPGAQGELGRFRSHQPPDALLTDTSQRIEALGARRRRARVAVAVSKNDLIAALPPMADVGADPAAVEAWLIEHLGLGNLVRNLRHEFRHVRFFFTAAVLNGDGRVDRSVVELARWLFEGEGVAFREVAS